MINRYIKIFLIFSLLICGLGVINASDIPIVLKVSGNIELNENAGSFLYTAYVNNQAVSETKQVVDYDALKLDLYNGFFTEPFGVTKTGVSTTYSFKLNINRIIGEQSILIPSEEILVPNPNYQAMNYVVDIVEQPITTSKIKNNSIEGVDFKDKGIMPQNIKVNTIESSKIKNNSIEGSKFEDQSINSQKVLDNTIGYSKLKIESVTGTNKDYLVKTTDNKFSWASNLANEYEFGVDSELIKAVYNSQIVIGIKQSALTTNKFKDSSIITSKLKDSAVVNSKLANDSIITDKISDNSVTFKKIKDSAIIDSKITSENITQDKLSKREYYSLLKCNETYLNVDGEFYDSDFSKCNIAYNNSDNEYEVTYNNIEIKDGTSTYYLSTDKFLANMYCNKRGGSLVSYDIKNNVGQNNLLIIDSGDGRISKDSGADKINNITCKFYYVE